MTEDDDEKPLHPKRRADADKQFVYVGDKQLKRLQKKAWDAGWYPEEKRKGIMWKSPDQKSQVMLHSTDSDHRAYDNALGEFRRAGLDV